MLQRRSGFPLSISLSQGEYKKDGAAASETLARENGRFDLILSDIKMPIMDGIAFALIAARDFPQVPILLMTGFADQRERANGLDALIHDVVTKPFSLAEIRRAVHDALNGILREEPTVLRRYA